MLKIDRNSPLFIVFRFKGSLFRRLRKQIFWVSLPTAILCLVHELGYFNLQMSFSLPGLLGAALGILLVFRNNTAYERWWEARKVLGALVNTCRSFALQCHYLLKGKIQNQQLTWLIAAFPFTLKGHLRNRVQMGELYFLDQENFKKVEKWAHKPNALADSMTSLITKYRRKDLLTDYQMVQLLNEMDKLVVILGKCERIKNTPMPMAHNYLLKVYVFTYTLIMPFGFVGSLGWWSILAVAVIYFVAMSIVTIAEEIEEPFGTDPNDLPVDQIANNIFKNIKEIIENEESLPPEYMPDLSENPQKSPIDG